MTPPALPTAAIILGLFLAAPSFGATPTPPCTKHCKSSRQPLSAPLPPRPLVADRTTPVAPLARDIATLKAARLALAR